MRVIIISMCCLFIFSSSLSTRTSIEYLSLNNESIDSIAKDTIKHDIDRNIKKTKQQLEKEHITQVINRFKDSSLTIKNVKEAINIIGIQRSNDAFIHICRESGNFSSEISIKANNLCGMRKPYKRQTYSLNKIYKGYATYKHWIHSVIDYWIWQGKGEKRITGNYRKYLTRRGYYPNTSE